ncbi:MAG: DUF1611 domain-containing protein [Alphaproteobacteria bacterium]|nr:DUF1611 domain-containing protein [Alphaproteobacteria bacterium]
MKIQHPYLMFLGDAPDQLAAKTASGIVHWRRDWCLGQFQLPACKADLGLPEMTIAGALAAGCRTLVIGVANRGGVIPDAWIPTMVDALEGGMDIAAGLHQRVADIGDVAKAADTNGRQLFDVRHPTRSFNVGSGERRPGKRLLTVGTDCSVGKMYTALAIDQALQAENVKSDFRATGQTGIFIAGDGVSVDAVVSDFISGATEWLTPANDPDHWDLVEGQGSLFHPSYAGVTMGLVHGAQPDALVVCHEPTRTHMRGLPHQPLPDIQTCIDGHLAAARLTNPDAVCVGVAVNSSGLASDEERRRCLTDIAAQTGLPAVDPVIDGVAAIVTKLT